MTIFKEKVGSFRKYLKNVADFVFVSAPHSTGVDGELSWWFTSDDNTYVSKEPSDCDKGFSESIKFLEDFISEHGPFDGLLGFSQGGAFAAIICSLIQAGKFNAEFKYVILFSAFKSRCLQHASYYETPLDIPSLHVIGNTDQVIVKERSEELLEFFKVKKVLRHPGGHYVPASKEYKEAYSKFILCEE